jgi:hypothetical protein
VRERRPRDERPERPRAVEPCEHRAFERGALVVGQAKPEDAAAPPVKRLAHDPGSPAPPAPSPPPPRQPRGRSPWRPTGRKSLAPKSRPTLGGRGRGLSPSLHPVGGAFFGRAVPTMSATKPATALGTSAA